MGASVFRASLSPSTGRRGIWSPRPVLGERVRVRGPRHFASIGNCGTTVLCPSHLRCRSLLLTLPPPQTLPDDDFHQSIQIFKDFGIKEPQHQVAVLLEPFLPPSIIVFTSGMATPSPACRPPFNSWRPACASTPAPTTRPVFRSPKASEPTSRPSASPARTHRTALVSCRPPMALCRRSTPF